MSSKMALSPGTCEGGLDLGTHPEFSQSLAVPQILSSLGNSLFTWK